MKADLRAIAFYLPQYHRIPENDAWWGAGFTEWSNVRKAAPLFPGHYQPHVPGPLGYYDLGDSQVRRAQADLARAHGIHGFCYYHYWFSGKRLLETPFGEVLQSGEPDFPFCLCWANENWTRRWDGEDREVLVAQNYSHADDIAHIESLLPAFRDERYIRINGKPLFLVYKTSLLPNPKKTAEIWREAAYRAGIGEIYLARVENFLQELAPAPAKIGFDAAVEFAPHWRSIGPEVTSTLQLNETADRIKPRIYDYDAAMLAMLGRRKPDYKLFRGAFPSWDNTPRRARGPLMFINSAPEKYAFWLSQIGRHALENLAGDERLIFINAWNEWGEGCHLEPDERHGYRYLEATRLALRLAHDVHDAVAPIQPDSAALPFAPDGWYELLAKIYRNKDAPSPDDLELLGAFSQYSPFVRSPLLHEGIHARFDAILGRKRKQIADLSAWLSWRISGSLRKMRDVLFK
jgi:lipopolysaccharide biosynthesis protein